MKKINNNSKGLKYLLVTVAAGLTVSFGSYVMAAPLQQNSFFQANSVIVYGSQNKATAKEENIVAFNLRKQMKSAALTSADNRLNEASLRRSNLVILSTGKSNNILNYGNIVETNLPIRIESDHFVFGDKFYSGKNDGIALIYPSPFNASRYVLIYHSNSVAGLDMLVKNAKISYENDYQVLNETGKPDREGKFNKQGFSWTYDARTDRDLSRVTAAGKEMRTRDTNNFRFFFTPDSYAAGRIDTIVRQYESYYGQLVRNPAMGLTDKVNVYLYDSKAERMNASPTGFNVKSRNIYAVFNNNENETLTEFSRFYFNDVLSFSDDQLIESAFVHYASDLKSGALDPQIARLFRQNKIPNLLFLIKRETTSPDSDIIVGSFTKYLINNYGMENYKAIISRAQSLDRGDELANITPNLFTSFSRLEREWKYTLSDLARKHRS